MDIGLFYHQTDETQWICNPITGALNQDDRSRYFISSFLCLLVKIGPSQEHISWSIGLGTRRVETFMSNLQPCVVCNLHQRWQTCVALDKFESIKGSVMS